MIKHFFVLLGLISFVLFHKVFITFGKVYKAIITGYYAKGMKLVGKGISIEYPVSKIHGRSYISIGDYSVIGKRAVITAWNKNKVPTLSIGNNVAIGDDCHITASNSIIIGDGTLIGNKVTITDNSHGSFVKEDLLISPADRKVISKGGVVIGNNVWVGDKVSILPGVNIGDGCVIGANSVVTHNVPSFSLVVGSPAKLIKNTEI